MERGGEETNPDYLGGLDGFDGFTAHPGGTGGGVPEVSSPPPPRGAGNRVDGAEQHRKTTEDPTNISIFKQGET